MCGPVRYHDTALFGSSGRRSCEFCAMRAEEGKYEFILPSLEWFNIKDESNRGLIYTNVSPVYLGWIAFCIVRV